MVPEVASKPLAAARVHFRRQLALQHIRELSPARLIDPQQGAGGLYLICIGLCVDGEELVNACRRIKEFVSTFDVGG